MKMLRRFVQDESGATAIEYTIVASLLSIAAIGAFRVTGANVNALMTSVAGAWR